MKGIFIPDITVEMFRNGCLEAIEALIAEGEIYDIEYDLKSAQPEVIRCKDCKRYGQDNCFMKIQMLWELEPNDFCSQAERRTDE